MFWLTFVILSLVLYMPPFDLARRLWAWAAVQTWVVPLVGLRWPAWLAYASWLAVIYLALATALHFAHRRLPQGSRLESTALYLSRASLGSLGVWADLAAVLALLLAWPILPGCRNLYGWRLAISTPVAALAGLYVLAEALRLAEDNLWADRAYAAWRRRWLAERAL